MFLRLLLSCLLALQFLGNTLGALDLSGTMKDQEDLAINVATAGLMEKFGPPSTKALLASKKTPVFSDFVRYNAARSAFNTGLTMTITGKPLERALKEGGVQFIANTLGGYGSYQIDGAYGKGEFGYAALCFRSPDRRHDERI